ncbi:MAG: hypothetical protein KJZ83_04485, partial [Burkholderiaceae bacterium]|nr:hypothetical protein [Burkholderiaceae bacterium]
PLRYDAEIGTVRPAYGTSIGHALLAGQDDPAVLAYLHRAPLKKLTPRTIVDAATILKMVRKARERGFAPIADSFTLGASGVAAPVVTPVGATVAALSVIAPTARFEPRRESITEEVVAAARSIAHQLRGNAGPKPGAGRESHER